MTEDDFDRIREIVRTELHAFMSEFFQRSRRRPEEYERLPFIFDREVEHLHDLNMRFAAALDAGDLMKGCKYEKSKVDGIASDVKKIKKHSVHHQTLNAGLTLNSPIQAGNSGEKKKV